MKSATILFTPSYRGLFFFFLCFLGLFASVSQAQAYDLQVSLQSNRSNPTLLGGGTLSDTVYIFTSPDTDVDRVQFWLDDPTMAGPPRQVENNLPYDFAGGAVSSANGFNTQTVSDGSHTITALLKFFSGGSQVIHATFSVDNGGGGTPTFELFVSTASNRSGPAALEAADVSSTIYVFTSPDTDVDRVSRVGQVEDVQTLGRVVAA